MKLLHITIDRKLTFENHAFNLCPKVGKKMGPSIQEWTK